MNTHTWVVGDDVSISHRRRIDGGAFGQVHELYNKHTGVVFARKVLLVREYGPGTATFSDIRKEIRAVKKLCISNTHPNIVTVFKIGSRSNPRFYFIDMELCDFNLHVYIQRTFPPHLRGRVRQFLEVEKLTVDERRLQILGVLRDIIAGVEYIHSAGEIHRDLKPQNVLYSCKDSAWKIADFGFTTEGSSDRMYISHWGRGTPGYRAPELEFFTSTSRYNNKADIWALGCILYEILFKRPPFQNTYAVKDFAEGKKTLKFPETRGMCDDSRLGKFILEVLHLEPGKRPGVKELRLGIEKVFTPVERKLKAVVMKGNENRKQVPITGAIRGIKQASIPEIPVAERPVHPLFRNIQRPTPQMAALANPPVVAATNALGTNLGVKPGGNQNTTQRQNDKNQDANRSRSQLLQSPKLSCNLGSVSPARKKEDAVPGTAPAISRDAYESRQNSPKKPSPRIGGNTQVVDHETIAKRWLDGAIRRLVSSVPQIAAVLPQETSSTLPVGQPHNEYIPAATIEVRTVPPISGHRETANVTPQIAQFTTVTLEQEHEGEDKLPESPPLATIPEINSSRSHPANRDQNRDAPGFPPLRANGNLPLNRGPHTREPSLYGDGNSESHSSINEELRISTSQHVNDLTGSHEIQQDGSIEPISVPGDVETGALEIEFVEHVVVNEANTHIGALVVTKKSSQKPSATQIRLWEAHSGKLVWHRNLLCDAEITCRPSFATVADGNYFCYQDGRARLMTLDIKSLEEQIRLRLPVNQESGMDAFEWNLTTHGVKAFALHSSLERIALAVPETSHLEHLKVKSVVNRFLPSGIVKRIDQIYVPQKPEFAVPFPIELYYTARRHLFIAWHDTKKVVIACFDFVTGHLVSQIENSWNTPREFMNGFNVSGVLSWDGEDCVIVTVPLTIQHPILTSRFRAPALRLKTIILTATGREVAVLMISEGGPSKQRREIIVSEGKVMRCCWTEDKGVMEIWSQNRFSTICRFTFAAKAPSVGSKVAYDRGELSMLSPDGKFQFLVPRKR